MVLLVSPTSAMPWQASMEDPQGVGETHAAARFDIDEQPLADALRAFSERSGIAVLFDDALVADRRTAGVHGMVSPHDALRILLVGTGLSAHFSSMNAFTVTASATSRDDTVVPPGATASQLTESEAASIQRIIEQALCARADTHPGTFRLAMQVWLDGSDTVSELKALAPSHDTRRDARVLAALHGVHLPSGAARFSPVTVLLVPSAPGTDPCRGPRAWEG
jgi:hypothetical protein